MSIHLRRTEENLTEIEAAARSLGHRVGLEGLLGRLNRQAAPAKVPGRAVDWGFQWNNSDQSSERWFPQGVTTSADANRSGTVQGRRLLVTSWYSKTVDGHNQGSRVTVVDLDTLAYRHVLLVVPRTLPDGTVELAPLAVHAGGIVWCEDYLHVAGTRRGLFSFRMDDLIELESTQHTFGYRFVLPVGFAYEADAVEGVEKMRYSFLSLDRGSDPPQLLAGEYGLGEMTRRLVRFPLDSESALLAHEDGTSRPVWLDERGLGHMQGAAVVGETYYVTSSRGRYRLGWMYVGTPGHFRSHPRALPIGPEDISYWPETDTFWSLSEYPGHRYVFSMRRSNLEA